MKKTWLVLPAAALLFAMLPAGAFAAQPPLAAAGTLADGALVMLPVSQDEDKDYFLEKLKQYNEMGEKLSEELRKLTESLEVLKAKVRVVEMKVRRAVILS